MKTAILGYGKSGKTAERIMKYLGETDISIFDDRFDNGNKIANADGGFDLYIVSPGIDTKILDIPRDKISSEIEVAYNAVLGGKVFLGITGTNGKSTITYLTAEILRTAGVKASYCGNIGNTLGDTFLDEDPDVYVVELSSFQIDILKNIKMKSACISNITPDHLDRYGSMEKYIESKGNIGKFVEETLFIPDDDELINKLSDQFCYFRMKSVSQKLDKYPELRGEILDFGKFYVNVSKYKLFGFHNVVNLAYSLLLCNEIVKFEGDVSRYIENLTALEHRCEYVDEVNGVVYINDSKGTNVDSTLTALKSSPADTALILGGRDKKGDFTALADEINAKVSCVLIYGEARFKINEQLKELVKRDIILFHKLHEAIDYAFQNNVGKSVLFSPACASFDQFKSFEERGKYFKEYVKGLKK